MMARQHGLPWLLIAGVLLAVPVVIVPWPPSTDLSLHAGMVALLARRGDPAFAPPGLYELALGHANQLFYFLAWPLALVTQAEVACRVVLAAIVAGTILAAGHLATYLGRTRWAALAVAPAALGWSFYWGFAPQMLGLALWIAALPVLDRDARRGTAWCVARSSMLMVLLGLAHVTSLLCGCLATTIFALTRPVDRRTLARLTPAAVGLLLALGEERWEHRVATPLATLFANRVLWHPVGRKLSSLVAHITGAHGATVEGMIALLVLLAVVAWRIPVRARQAHPLRTAGLLRRLEDRRFTLLASALMVLYLAAPYSVNFGAFLYVRFLGPAFVLAMLLVAPPANAGGLRVVVPAIALFVAPVLAALPQLQAARQQSRAIEPILARVDMDSAVAVLHFGRHDPSLLFNPTALGNRVLARRGGRLLSSFAEYPVAPVVVRSDLRWDSILLRTATKSGLFAPASDLGRIRWLIVHVYDISLSFTVIAGLSPEAELVDTSGEWLLFRSTLATVPIDSPDDPSIQRADTLQDRVSRLLRARTP